MKREYKGNPLDMSWQDIQDRPYKGEGETVGGSTKDDSGDIKTIGVPEIPTNSPQRERRNSYVKAFRGLDNDELHTIAKQTTDDDAEICAYYVLVENMVGYEKLKFYLENVHDDSVEMFKSFLKKNL